MKFVSSESVVRALKLLSELSLRRSGRTAAVGYLLLKAKEPSPGARMEITSQGENSVEPELERFLRVAPGTSLPDLNPFGSHEGGVEYLASGYARRGTYTHLYEGRNLSGFLDVTSIGRAFQVRVPADAAKAVTERLGRKLPLEPTAAFFLRSEPFDNSAEQADVLARFREVFHLGPAEEEALFHSDPSFEINFAAEPFRNELASLPVELRPRTSATSSASAERANRTLIQLAKLDSSDLVLSDAVHRRIQRGFSSSKAIALVGPPGTAKSKIWATLLERAAADPSILGLKHPPVYKTVTAEVDWTARTVVGGYYPQEDGKLVFREGFLLQAIRENQLLWIDEMNRADLDRVLGPVLTFLAGQTVDLGPSHLGELDGERPPKKMALVWGADAKSGCKEDEELRVYYAGTDWRLLGTYNNVDRGRVFPMGSALLRRWALVPITPVGLDDAEDIISQTGVRLGVADILVRAYGAHLRFLPIGLAPFVDMARYVGADDRFEDEPLTRDERELLADAYVLYMGQQLGRLDPESREDFFQELANIFGQELADEAASF